MNKLIITGVVGCMWGVAYGWSQEINVTTAGVEIGAVDTSASGALIQQSGQDTSFVVKDGVSPPSIKMVIKADGKVGIGTSAPSAKLDVAGTAKVDALVVGESTIFNVGTYESSEQSIPGHGNAITLSHGLGGRPRFATVSLRCKTAEHGWAVGDEILLNSISIISNNHGVTMAMNSSSLKLTQYGSIYIHVFDSTSNVQVATPANWRLIFRAWR